MIIVWAASREARPCNMQVDLPVSTHLKVTDPRVTRDGLSGPEQAIRTLTGMGVPFTHTRGCLSVGVAPGTGAGTREKIRTRVQP